MIYTSTATFTVLETVDVTSSNQKFTVNFTNYTGSDQYIGFRKVNVNQYTYVFIDDIVWEAVPNCLEPIAVTKANVTNIAASISWNAPTPAPVSYHIYYSTIKTIPTGTTVPSATGITTTSYNITGLTPSTKYYYWLRSACSGTNVSTWTAIDSFSTACNPVSVPYVQDFESAVVPGIPTCTQRENAGIGNNWITSNNPGYGFTSKTLQYSYNSNAANAWFYTQGITLTAGTSYRLTFKYGNNSSSYSESMEVKYGTGASVSSMTTTIVDLPVIKLAGNAISTTDFTPATTGVYYLGFHANSGANQWNMYLDDVSVTLAPTCDNPVNILSANVTTTSAQVDWTAPTIGTPTGYDVYYSAFATAPVSGTTPTIAGLTGTSVNLSSLVPSTRYYVWVRTICGTSGVSGWSAVATFSTACGVVTAPTIAPEGFGATLPGCMTKSKGVIGSPTVFTSSTSSAWTVGNYRNISNPADRAAVLNIYGAFTSDWLFTPSYDLGTTKDFILEFDLALTKNTLSTATTLGVDDKFAVLISTDNGVTWTETNALRTWTSATPISNTGEHIVLNLSAYTGTVMFGFYGESTAATTGDDNDLFIDNIAISRVLPVKLAYFKGERQGAKNALLWSTATEQNNKGFEILRSADGQKFSTIGFVETKSANGSGVTALNYNYNDDRPAAGNNYYRLKQIDFDGKSQLSNVVLIKSVKSNEIYFSSVYPNPAKSKINVILSSPTNDKVTLVITDLAGKTMKQFATQVINGDNNVSLNVESLASGTYMIKAICNNGCETTVSKFIKQ